MEGTPAVKQAVENREFVMACAYQGYVPAAVTEALPTHFQHRRYVAKFMGGKLVELRHGLPEEVMVEMLAGPAGHAEEDRPAPPQPAQ